MKQLRLILLFVCALGLMVVTYTNALSASISVNREARQMAAAFNLAEKASGGDATKTAALVREYVGSKDDRLMEAKVQNFALSAGIWLTTALWLLLAFPRRRTIVEYWEKFQERRRGGVAGRVGNAG